MASFPDAQWFLTLGQLMQAEGELFRRLGYAETRFAVRVVPNNGSNGGDRIVGLVIDGYQLTEAKSIADLNEYDPDFVICGQREIWDRMLGEIAANGRPQLRHTLSSLALVGEELWLESTDQLREDKFYRFNQTLQELLNLAAKVPA
ncbi:MAG TPA: hypothetical protein VEU51_15645 [Candidatus Acidoferrales bacterium]|nr:hypothetical protein [Candidatus Acidoferrales bacterium]